MNEDSIMSINKIISNRKYKKLESETHHYTSNRYKHSLEVSRLSYKICKKLGLDYDSALKGALLHDFFLNDEFNNNVVRILTHGQIALKNAEKITKLNDMERNIISSHMFPFGGTIPKYKESVIVDLVDDYVSVKEVVVGNARVLKAATMYLFIVLTELLIK